MRNMPLPWRRVPTLITIDNTTTIAWNLLSSCGNLSQSPCLSRYCTPPEETTVAAVAGQSARRSRVLRKDLQPLAWSFFSPGHPSAFFQRWHQSDRKWLDISRSTPSRPELSQISWPAASNSVVVELLGEASGPADALEIHHTGERRLW